MFVITGVVNKVSIEFFYKVNFCTQVFIITLKTRVDCKPKNKSIIQKKRKQIIFLLRIKHKSYHYTLKSSFTRIIISQYKSYYKKNTNIL